MTYKILSGASAQELQAKVQDVLATATSPALVGPPFQDARGNWYQAVTYTGVA